MKNLYIFYFISIIPTFLFSQSNQLNIFFHNGMGFYNSNDHYGAGLKYDRILGERFTTSLATSISSSSDNIRDFRKNENSFSERRFYFPNKEWALMTDIKLSYALFGTIAKHNLEAGTGISLLYINLDYPKNITFIGSDPRTPPLAEYGVFKSNTLMYNVFLDYDYRILEQLYLMFNITVRGTFRKQPTLTRPSFLLNEQVVTSEERVDANATTSIRF